MMEPEFIVNITPKSAPKTFPWSWKAI